MRRFKYLIVSILLFSICSKVSAAACPNSEKVTYQSLAKNITSSYEYIEETRKFNIHFTNVDENLYIRELTSEKNYEYTGNEMVLSDFKPGKSYKFGIYTSDARCSGVNMYTIYVTLPYYNSFYQDELCSGIENYKYCKKFINKKITYSEFESYVTSYKESLNKESNEEIESSTSSLLDVLLDDIFQFYLSYYYIILPIIIILSLLLRWYYNKKRDLF